MLGGEIVFLLTQEKETYLAEPTVDPDNLNKLLEDAGVGERTRKKLIKANEGKKKSEKPARGHGPVHTHTPQRF